MQFVEMVPIDFADGGRRLMLMVMPGWLAYNIWRRRHWASRGGIALAIMLAALSVFVAFLTRSFTLRHFGPHAWRPSLLPLVALRSAAFVASAIVLLWGMPGMLRVRVGATLGIASVALSVAECLVRSELQITHVAE